jgi:hypothetical protein
LENQAGIGLEQAVEQAVGFHGGNGAGREGPGELKISACSRFRGGDSSSIIFIRLKNQQRSISFFD